MKKYIFLTLFPILALAEGHGTNYDIVWRTINFLIFFGIMYYLLKGPLKAAYENRINSIASRLEANQNLLKESKERKEQAKKDVATAKIQGDSLVETAKKEAIFAEEKVKNATEFEIKQLQKAFEEQKEFETRKAKKDVVNEILEEIFDKNSINLDQNELIDIVHKKAV